MASNYGSIGLGEFARAKNTYAVAIGYDSITEGEYAISAGAWANAKGDRSLALGAGSVSKGYLSTAIGGGDANYAKSVAIGYASIADKENSVALGENSHANREAETLSYNIEKDEDFKVDTLFDYLGESKKNEITKLTTNIAEYNNEIKPIKAELDKLNKYLNDMHNKGKYVDDDGQEYDYDSENEGKLEARIKPVKEKYDEIKRKIDNETYSINKVMGRYYGTLAAVSIGDEEKGYTRQLIGVAAATKDTDAVNLLQLKHATNFSRFIYNGENIDSTSNPINTNPNKFIRKISFGNGLKASIPKDKDYVLVELDGQSQSNPIQSGTTISNGIFSYINKTTKNPVVLGEDGKFYAPEDIKDKKFLKGKGYVSEGNHDETPVAPIEDVVVKSQKQLQITNVASGLGISDSDISKEKIEKDIMELQKDIDNSNSIIEDFNNNDKKDDENIQKLEEEIKKLENNLNENEKLEEKKASLTIIQNGKKSRQELKEKEQKN